MKPQIYQNVKLGENVSLGLGVIIGETPRGHEIGDLKTVIAANAVIRSHSVIYAGNRIGRNFQSGHHVMIREENEIGDDVSIGTGTIIEHHVRIDDGVRIHSQAFVPEYCVLEKECWIGPNVVLTNAKYPNLSDTKEKLIGVRVGKKAIIGANATMLPGIHVGERAFVGAGSVVSRDVLPGAVVFGNPARVHGGSSELGY